MWRCDLDKISSFVDESFSERSILGRTSKNTLVGGWPTPLKNMSSSVGIIIPNLWKNKTCSKPPTSTSWGVWRLELSITCKITIKAETPEVNVVGITVWKGFLREGVLHQIVGYNLIYWTGFWMILDLLKLPQPDYPPPYVAFGLKENLLLFIRTNYHDFSQWTSKWMKYVSCINIFNILHLLVLAILPSRVLDRYMDP